MLSPRAAFLAGLARRRIDDDDGSDSEGVGSGEEDYCGDESSVDTAALLQKSIEVTPPRARAALREMERLLKATPPDRADKSASVLGRRRSGLRGARKPSLAAGTASKQSAKTQPTAKVASSPPPPPPPLTRMSPSSSPLLRRAESRRRRAKDDDQAENKSAISNVGTPPRKGAHHLRSSKVVARSTPPRASKGRPVLEMPVDLTSSNSSSYEGEEDDVMSVLSTASILKASSTVETAPLSASYSYSISHSKSSGSSGSRISAAIKKVESIGGLKSKGSGSDDDASLVESLGGSVVTSEGYEVSLVRSESTAGRAYGKATKASGDIPQSRSEEFASPGRGGRRAEMHRLRQLKRTGPKSGTTNLGKEVTGVECGRDQSSRSASLGRLAKARIDRDEMEQEEKSKQQTPAVTALSARARRRKSRSLSRTPGISAKEPMKEIASPERAAAPNRDVPPKASSELAAASPPLLPRTQRRRRSGIEMARSPEAQNDSSKLVPNSCPPRSESARRIALWCQSSYRGTKAREKLDFKDYCATRIQAAMRGYLAFTSFMDSQSRIIAIQSIWRMQIQRKRYHRLVKERAENEATLVLRTAGATKIQSCWRRHLASEYFIFVLSEVIVCQSVARKRIAMQNYRETLTAREASATLIQKMYRGFTQRMEYIITITDIITTQSVARQFLAKRELQARKQLRWAQEFIKKEDAATKIQASYVGYITRMDYLISISNIILCQSVARRVIAGRKLRVLQHEQKEQAATKIRAAYLGYLSRIEYCITISDVITIQSKVRGIIAKREAESRRQIRHAAECAAATKISSAFRGYVARVDFIVAICNVITLQSAARKVIAQKELEKLRHEHKEKAATKIRAVYLGYTARLDYMFTVADITTMQRCFRGYQARGLAGQMRRTRDNESATKIQAAARGMIAKRAFERTKGAAITIQKTHRAFVAYENYVVDLANIMYMQAIVRKFLAKKELTKRRQQWKRTNECATSIQTCWRSYKAQTDFALTIWGVITLQALVRRRLQARRYDQLRRNRDNECATTIQTCWRSYKAETDFSFTIWSIISLQSLVRRRLEARRYAQMRWDMAKKNATHIREVEIGATTMIQSCFRGYLAKCERKRLMHEEEERARQADIAKRNAAATAIQSCWRGYREFVRCLTITYSIVQIQTWARGCEARRQLQIRRYGPMRLQHAAATAIQTSFRGYRSFLKYAIMQYFVVKIQAAVRGRQGKRRVEQMRQFELEQRRKNPTIYAISKAKRKSLPSQRNRVPSAQNLKLRKLREKRAALTIERFFMRIKAEIELEMRRLEERERNRKKGKKKRHSERGGSQPSVSSAYSFSGTGHRWDAGSRSGSAATVATPSHVQHPAWMGSPNAQNYLHQHPMRSPSLSIEPVPSVPSLGSNSTRDAFVRGRVASPALQQGGYNNTPPCNEAHRKSPPPSSYGHRPHPNLYPQSGGNSMNHPGAYGLHQSRSFASTASHHAPNPVHPHQWNALPSSRSVSGMQQQPSAPYPMAGTDRYPPHQMHNTPVGGHYAMPQRPPAQRQTQAPPHSNADPFASPFFSDGRPSK